MKNMFRFSALLCAMAVLVTSCTKDETLEPQRKPVAVGDQIVFGARAGFESSNPDSRTVYSGETYEIEIETSDDTKKTITYEGINWVKNDIVAICSPDANAAADKNVIYRVSANTTGQTGTNDHTRDYATLTPAYEGAGMQWGSNTTHTFYAMYPHQLDTEVDGNKVTLHQGVKLEGSTMTGIIPSSYVPTVTLNDNTYTATPDMRYAYMVAKTTVAPSASVSLDFVPVVTAVEIELLFPEGDATNGYYPITVGEITLSSATQKLSGGFTANLATWDPTSAATPTCELITSEDVASQNYVTISTLMYDSNLGIDAPITLNEGQSIKVTAFLLPHTDITDLTVSYAPRGGATPRSKSLAAEIPAKLKTRITKVKLPTTAKPDEPDPDEPDPGLGAENWMKELVARKPDVTMAGLSLPGTGGSFTYLSSLGKEYREQYKEGDDEMYTADGKRTTDMDFDKQWSLGIRAFEIASDRPTYSTSMSLYGEQITCNKRDVGLTVGAAMEMIIKKVQAYPNEAAVVILVYQPEATNPTRNAAYYATALKAMYQKLTDFKATDRKDPNIPYDPNIFKLYTPGMKLSEAAGHVLLVARINQRDEDENSGDSGTGNGSAASNWNTASETLKGLPIMVIDGCGTAKDKWGTRGYMSDGAKVDDINWSYGAVDNGTIMESFLQYNGDYLWGAGSYTNDVISYPYNAKTVSRERSLTNWFYEWSHVVSRPNPASRPNDADFALGFGYTTNVGYDCWYQEWARVVAEPYHGDSMYWFESYYEKLNHVFMTFDMAINNVNTNQVYFNSLCGYLVTSSIPESYEAAIYGSTTGGEAGDIQGLAKKITPQFYQYVLKRSKDNTTGPTGVVMLDYVSDNPAEGGSHYLPGLIIANNLKSN